MREIKEIKRCSCGWPLDHEGECTACRVRKSGKLPASARCETCARWRVVLRCLNFGPHAVCRSWCGGSTLA